MFLYRIAPRILTVAVAVSAAIPSSAADDFGARQNHHHRQQASVGTNGLPSYIPHLGTYGGAISALRVRGNGNYFAIDNGLSRPPRSGAAMPLAPKARIIHVNDGANRSACSYEHGVCVIRP